MGGDPRGGAQQAQPDAARLHGAPAAAEEVRAQDVEELVGEHGEAPQQGVAAEVVHRGAAGRELAQLLDPLLDDRARVVGAPRLDGADAPDIDVQGKVAGLLGVSPWDGKRS